MSLKPEPIGPIPEATARVAKAACPKGSTFMHMRDELGTLFQDEMFMDLFPKNGHPALAPWRLALVTIMQFAEGLSDRQAAEAVRTRIDWKYALGLELEDEGFDFSVLCEFRGRLLSGHGEYLLFETMINDLKQRRLRQPQEDDNEPMPHISWRQCVRSIGSSVWEKRCAQHSIRWQKLPQSGFALLLPMSGMSVMLIGLKSIGCPREKRSAPLWSKP